MPDDAVVSLQASITSRNGTGPNLRPAPPKASWAGSRIRSFDGKRIGEVEAVVGNYLKVRRPFLLPDYWLPNVLVRGEHDGDLVLHVEKPTLRKYQLR